MTKRKLKQLAINASQASFKNGKVVDSKARSFIKLFKQLPTSKAVLALKEYQKALKYQLEKHTLEIESTTPLSVSEVKKISNQFKDLSVSNIVVRLNPDLLGGIKFRIADTVYDYSISDKIRQVKEAING